MPANEPPRPLVLVDTIDVGGVGKGVLQLIRGFLAAGSPVVLANFEYAGRPSAFAARAAESGALYVPLRQRHRLDFSCAGPLGELAVARGANCIESHSLKAHLLAWAIARRTGLSWIAHAHGWTSESRRVRAYNVLERRLLRIPQHVCVVSAALAAELRAAGRRGPITVLRNGVEAGVAPIGDGERLRARAQLALDADDFLVLCLARLSHEKGVDVLLAALPAVVARAPRARLVLAGAGPERVPLERLARRLGIAERVRFAGVVADTRALYAAADVVCLPSRSEGVPNVALEALDAGVPLVATAVGAVPEMVRDGETGWLVAPDDPVALADALVAAARAPELRRRRAATGRREILPLYTAQARVRRVLELYAALLGARVPG